MVVAHSGALAGEHGAYEAVFDAYGVHACRDLEEMADAIELFQSPRRVTTGTGVASLHDSGERALFVDLGSDLGVPFADVSDGTRAKIDAVLDPGLVADNPLDAWGTGIDADRIYRESFQALHDDPETAAVAFVVDLTRQGEPYDEGYLQVARDVWETTTKPFCLISNLPATIAKDEVGVVRGGDPGPRGDRDGAPRPEAPAGRRGVPRAPAGRRSGRVGGVSPASGDGSRNRADPRDGGARAAGRVRHPGRRRAPRALDRRSLGGRCDRVPGRGEDGDGALAQVRRGGVVLGVADPEELRDAYATCRNGSVRTSRPRRWRNPASRSRSSCATRRSGRWCWWRRAASWWSSCTTASWRSRSTRTPPAA